MPFLRMHFFFKWVDKISFQYTNTNHSSPSSKTKYVMENSFHSALIYQISGVSPQQRSDIRFEH